MNAITTIDENKYNDIFDRYECEFEGVERNDYIIRIEVPELNKFVKVFVPQKESLSDSIRRYANAFTEDWVGFKRINRSKSDLHEAADYMYGILNMLAGDISEMENKVYHYGF